MKRTPEPGPRALPHPLWWGALVVLVVNDHLLKGAGVLPPALTGKLSDFAGLLVAPALLAQVIPGLLARARAALATAAIGGLFAAINLWPAASLCVERVLRGVAPGARLWPDPGDLIALAVLPLSYALCLPRARMRVAAAPARAVAERAAVALGAAACLATAGIFGDDEGGGASTRADAPDVRNATGEPLLLVISSTEGAGGCELYERQRVGVLSPDAFAVRREVVLEDGARSRLLADPSTTRCGAAWLQLPDGDEAHVYWRDLEQLDSFVSADDDRRADRRVRIEGEPGRYRVALGNDLERFSPGDEVEDATCEPPRVEHDLSWSALPIRQGWLELVEVERDDTGCLALVWMPLESDALDAGMGGAQQLCVPPWAFPFDAGDLLSVIEQPVPEGGRRLRVTRYRDDRLELQLELWHEAAGLEGSLAHDPRPQACFGELLPCGAYVRPLELEVRGEEDALGPGDEATVTAGDAAETRVLLGDAREVAWTASACTGSAARVGPSASMLELRTY